MLGRTEMPKRKKRELGSERQMGMKLLLPDPPGTHQWDEELPWLHRVVEESWVKGVHEKESSAGE